MKITALIMAGGRGERFWPLSRKNMPKQFLVLTDEKLSLIQKTVERIGHIVDDNDIYIVTNKDYVDIINAQLPQISMDNIIVEPCGRNTAPCIALGTVRIMKNNEDSIVVVLPSDHYVADEQDFVNTIRQACEYAKAQEQIVSIGINPGYAETAYGYIKSGKAVSSGIYECQRFVEKPDYDTAVAYIKDGSYLWNSGIYVWSTSTIMKEYSEHAGGIYELMNEIGQCLDNEGKVNELFAAMEAISVDYAIMEKTHNIKVIKGYFGWDDVGSWPAIGRLREPDDNGNVITGEVVTTGCSSCIINGRDRMIAAVGLKDVVIVDTGDTVLVADKNRCSNIRDIISTLKDTGRDSYL